MKNEKNRMYTVSWAEVGPDRDDVEIGSFRQLYGSREEAQAGIDDTIVEDFSNDFYDGDPDFDDDEKLEQAIKDNTVKRDGTETVVEREIGVMSFYRIDEVFPPCGNECEDCHGKEKTGISGWDWSTLVASWRYFQYRNTISSSMFPSDVVSRFWGSGKYDSDSLLRIANQFANVDHHGEDDWVSEPKCDRRPWAKFYAFCKGVCDGFDEVKLGSGDDTETVKCFKCKTTGRMYPVQKYVSAPLVECYIDEGSVTEGLR